MMYFILSMIGLLFAYWTIGYILINILCMFSDEVIEEYQYRGMIYWWLVISLTFILGVLFYIIITPLSWIAEKLGSIPYKLRWKRK